MTEQPNIHEPSAPVIPSPWFRPPPGVDKGTPRPRTGITAGLLVSNDERHRWFNEKFGIKLPDHHRQDVNVPLRLNRVVREAGIALGCSFASRRLDPNMNDLLVLTQILSGHWVNDGPEEVLMEDVKPVPTANEEEVKKRLESELGIKTCGFKSYF
ncbi:hypothetical protein BYT27DRAFT_7201182, partial [Phlegmacium glaucopus]